MNKTITDILEKHNHPKYYLSPMLLEVLNAAIIEICEMQMRQAIEDTGNEIIDGKITFTNIAKTTPNA